MKENITLLQLVNFIFALSLGFALIFSISPLLFKEAKFVNIKVASIQKVDSIKINYTNNRKRYIQLILKTPNKNYIKHYFIPDNEHLNLIQFLNDKKIIEIGFDKSLPIELGKKQLSKFNIQFKNKNSKIEKLIIDGFYIAESSESNFKKHVMYLFGIISFTIGVLLLFLIFFVGLRYFRTGELPEIPNKIKGLKSIFKSDKK